jgi:prephenate dehydratase
VSRRVELLPFPTIASLFDAIETGLVERSVIPLANSTNGPVNQTLDLIAATSLKSDLEVCGETSVTVNHCLVGRRQIDEPDALSHITSLHTHPQAWTQCSPFLSRHFNASVSRVDEDSTSAAAELVSRDKTGESAAICSALAAELLGLDILAHNIQEDTDNATRFIVLRHKYRKLDGNSNQDPVLEQNTQDMHLIVSRIFASEEKFQEIVTKVEKHPNLAMFSRACSESKKTWVYLFINHSDVRDACGSASLPLSIWSPGKSAEIWLWGNWTETTTTLEPR